MRKKKRGYFICKIEPFIVNLRKSTFHQCVFLHLPPDTVSLDTFLKSGEGFLKVSKLIKEVILSENFSKPRPVFLFLFLYVFY